MLSITQSIYLMPKDQKSVKEGESIPSSPRVNVANTLLTRLSKIVTMVAGGQVLGIQCEHNRR